MEVDPYKVTRVYWDTLKRLELCTASQSFEVMGKFESIYDCPKYPHRDIGVKLTLKRSDPEFCLVSGTDCKPSYLIEYEEIILCVPKNSINSSVLAHHNRLFSSGKLVYPVNFVDMRCLNNFVQRLYFSSEIQDKTQWKRIDWNELHQDYWNLFWHEFRLTGLIARIWS